MSWPRLTFHLAKCKKRSYPRVFTVGKYQFTVFLNPLKRHVMALKRLATNPKINEAAFVGALLFMQEDEIIHRYEVAQVSQVPIQAPPLGSDTPRPRG